MAPVGTAGGTVKVLDLIAATVKTGNNAVLALLTYALPDNAALELDMSIQARNPGNGNTSWFRRYVRVKRVAGAPFLKSTITPVPDDDESGGLVVSAGLNGINVELRVAGLASVTLVWFGSARVQVFVP